MERSERNQGMMFAHAAGETYEQIGSRHGITAQAVHAAVERTTARYIRSLLVLCIDCMTPEQRQEHVVALDYPDDAPEYG